MECFYIDTIKTKNIKIENCLERTREWIISMQSQNGGWGAFDIDNNKYYLNSIPFADHGALLDPPTSDVTARCLSFLKQQNDPDSKQSIQKGLKYLYLNKKIMEVGMVDGVPTIFMEPGLFFVL